MIHDRPLRYILGPDGQPVPCADPIAWAEFCRDPARRSLRRDTLPGDVFVLTVFLGLDNNHAMIGPPVLWETMVFGPGADGYQVRYTSREEALDGHLRVVRYLEGHAPSELADLDGLPPPVDRDGP